MEILLSFIELIVDVWKTSSFGIGMEKMLVAFLIFLSFAFLRGLFSRFVLQRINRLAAKTETQIDDLLIVALERPLKFFFLVIGLFFAVQYLHLGGLSAVIAEMILKSFVAIGLFWFFYAAVTPLSYTLHNLENILSKEIVNWLVTVSRWGVILTGLATVLQIWGIQIGPIIAGFGLFGVAVALGAQDLFKNLLGGISILVERRFAIGDWIEVDGVVSGTIEQIGFRSTRVRRFDLVPVIVPNNMFSDHALVNYSQMTHRRIYWKVGLEYRTTSMQLRKVRDQILKWLKDDDAFLSGPQPPCFVYIDSFNDCSIDLIIYCFTVETDWETWLAHKDRLTIAIKEIVENAGTAFAFPSVSIYQEVQAQGMVANPPVDMTVNKEET